MSFNSLIWFLINKKLLLIASNIDNLWMMNFSFAGFKFMIELKRNNKKKSLKATELAKRISSSYSLNQKEYFRN